SAALVGPILVVIASRHVGCDPRQVGRLGNGGEHLRRPHIRAPHHADFAIGIRERGSPFDGIEAVGLLALEGIPFPSRGVPAAYVLDDDDIAARDYLEYR